MRKIYICQIKKISSHFQNEEMAKVVSLFQSDRQHKTPQKTQDYNSKKQVRK